jgi:hypothetical protein
MLFGCWSYVEFEVDDSGTVVKAVPRVHWNPGMYAGVRSTPEELLEEAEAEATALLGTRPVMEDGNPLYSPGRYTL